MKILEQLSIDDLKTIDTIVSQYDSIASLRKDLKQTISKKKEESSQNLNVRFNMEMLERLKVFDPWELRVVKANHIANLQELIDCNLDSLVGITPSIKQGLEWVRSFYDMGSVRENQHFLKK